MYIYNFYLKIKIMEELIIDNYYYICFKQSIFRTNEWFYNYTYTPPDNIDYLDFSLLVEFITKCTLIKNGTLPPDPTIDINKFPTQDNKLNTAIDYMIYVYNKCSKKSPYINISKARTFWNIYCIMKTIIFLDGGYDWCYASFPQYLINAIYARNKVFSSNINGISYSIYTDFVINPGYYYIFYKCSKFDPTAQWTNTFPADLRNLIPNIHLYPTGLAICLLNMLPNIYNDIELNNDWNIALRIVINSIKQDNNYPKDHPLSIMTNNTPGSYYKLNIFRNFFNLTNT